MTRDRASGEIETGNEAQVKDDYREQGLVGPHQMGGRDVIGQFHRKFSPPDQAHREMTAIVYQYFNAHRQQHYR